VRGPDPFEAPGASFIDAARECVDAGAAITRPAKLRDTIRAQGAVAAPIGEEAGIVQSLRSVIGPDARHARHAPRRSGSPA